MEILIEFSSERIVLPIASGRAIQGLIYRALSSDCEYSEAIHNFGKDYLGRKYKLFTFGELKGRYEISGENIVYFSNVALKVRSVDSYLIQLLFEYFTKNKYVILGNNTVSVAKSMIYDEHIYENKIIIRTLSPITVYRTLENGYTVYFSPDDPNFCESIVTNAKRKWASFYGSEDGFLLKINSVENAAYIKRATRFKTTFITAWHGPFVLEGSIKVLNFLYNTGLGCKNSQGFGMFEIKKD